MKVVPTLADLFAQADGLATELTSEQLQAASDDLPSLDDLLHEFDRLVGLVAQLDGPTNWVVNS